jgi:tetratricopeptide (TPR) repeat protein
VSVASAPAQLAPAKPPVHTWGRWEWLIGGALIAACLVVYGPVVRFDFVDWDDHLYVKQNTKLNLGLSPAGLYWGLTTFDVSNWHPLVWWSFLLDHELYGQNAAGYHVTNLVWHIGSVLLLFAALRRMTGAAWPSALAAALFALHPLHVEPVAWVSERKGIISTFFWMLALWCYARYVERPGWGRYLLVAVSLALGLMAKQMPVTLPLVLLLLDYWPLGRGPGKWQVLEKLPLLGLSLAAGLLAVAAQGSYGSVAPLQIIAPAARIKNAVVSFAIYLRQAVLPLDLAPYYQHLGDALPLWQVLAAGAVIVAITALVLWQARRRPYLLVGWCWYSVALMPVIGLMQVGKQAHADRYTYVPLVGIYIAAAWWLADVARARQAYRPVAALASLAVAACMILSWVQVHNWQDTYTLWSSALAATGGDDKSHSNLGSLYLRIDREVALQHFEKALHYDPASQYDHVQVGMLYLERLDFFKATAHFNEALRYHKDTTFAQLAHLNLGAILMDLGKLDQAADHFETALRIDPKFARAHSDMALFLARKGDRAGAAARFQKALELDPDNAATHLSLGTALLEEGKLDDARRHFTTAARLGPRTAELHLRNQAVACLAKGDVAATVVCLRSLPPPRSAEADATPWEDDPLLLDALAAAYAKLDKYADAAATSLRAQQRALDKGQPELARAIAERRRAYERP